MRTTTNPPTPITGYQEAQRIIRTASPAYLAQAGLFPQKKAPGPSTLAELSEALRDPLPKTTVVRPQCYSALDAMAAYKPINLEEIRQRLADERDARELILADYTKRTGQLVELCGDCDMGVAEEEVEEKYGTRVDSYPCEACDGLGVVEL